MHRRLHRCGRSADPIRKLRLEVAPRLRAPWPALATRPARLAMVRLSGQGTYGAESASPCFVASGACRLILAPVDGSLGAERPDRRKRSVICAGVVGLCPRRFQGNGDGEQELEDDFGGSV